MTKMHLFWNRFIASYVYYTVRRQFWGKIVLVCRHARSFDVLADIFLPAISAQLT